MTKLKMPAFMGNLTVAANMDKGIAFVRSNGERLDAIVHAVAVAIMRHAKDNGDCTRALRLVEAMPASGRRAALIQWFGQYSPIAVTYAKEAEKRRVGLRKVGTPGYNAFNIDAAEAQPYWAKQVANEEAALLGIGDANEKILKMADYLAGRVKAGKVDKDAVEAVNAKVAALRAAATVGAPKVRAAKRA